MKIAEASKTTSVSPRMIRYAERRGIIPPPERKTSGYRDYGEDDLRRLRLMADAQTVGFGLEQVAELLRILDGDSDDRDTEMIISEWISKLDGRAATIRALRNTVTRMRSIDPF